MKRRTVLKRTGIASAGMVAFAGSSSAGRLSASGASNGVDTTTDVSDVAGEVMLADVLSEEQLADVDASGVVLTVDAEVDEINPSEHCCDLKCCSGSEDCPNTCPCCRCQFCSE